MFPPFNAIKDDPRVEKLALNLKEYGFVSRYDTKAPSHISGSVSVGVKYAIHDLEHIRVRFLGVVDCKQRKKQLRFRGYQKLFDQTLEVTTVSHLKEGHHQFPFELSLPANNPPSINTPTLHIQYLVIAILGFKNGCCGMIPVLQSDPIHVKQELSVWNTGLHLNTRARMSERDSQSDDEESRVSILDLDNAAVICWSPRDTILVYLAPVQTLDSQWEILVQLLNASHNLELSLSVTETRKLHFSLDEFKNEPISETLIESNVHAFRTHLSNTDTSKSEPTYIFKCRLASDSDTESETMDETAESSDEFFTSKDKTEDGSTDLLPSVYTRAANVHHEAHLVLKVEDETFTTVVPIQLIKPSNSKN